MPRDDSDDRDDPDGRPRRRRESPGDKTVWIVLGVVGGVILLVIAGCGVGIYVLVNRATQVIGQMTQQFAGMAAAEAFCEDLKSNRANNAYNSTSKGYQAAHTRAQFDQLLAQHPELTKHQHRTVVSFNTTGQPPNQQVVVKLRLHAQPLTVGANPPDAADADDAPPQPQPKKGRPGPPPKAKEKKEPALQDIDVTLTVVDEGGVWKVDKIDIP